MTERASQGHDNEQILHRLVDEALYGLDDEQRAELHRLAHEQDPSLNDDRSLELAASALQLALLESEGRMEDVPNDVQQRIRQRVHERIAETGEAQQKPTMTATGPTPHDGRGPMKLQAWQWAGWIAAAACLIIAVFAWMPSGQPSPAERRAQLLERSDSVVRASWQALDDPAAEGASGDIVFDPTRQEGYMRFNGLAVNDPSERQYQLWIFDKSRPDSTPVDGGVFNIPESGEVVVPINPKLEVEQPYQFAVTVEKPGGVVVSSRERLPLLATLSS